MSNTQDFQESLEKYLKKVTEIKKTQHGKLGIMPPKERASYQCFCYYYTFKQHQMSLPLG